MLAYAVDALELSRSTILIATMIAAAVELFTIPFFGSLSDRMGRRPVYLFGAVFSLILAFPFFWLVNTASIVLITIAVVLALAVGHAAMYGPQGAFFSELFGTRVRYSGASLGYQLASIFAGALSPIVAAALFAATGSYVPVALLLAGMAAVTIVAVLVATETHRDDIEADRGAERQLIEESAGTAGPDGGTPQPRVR